MPSQQPTLAKTQRQRLEKRIKCFNDFPNVAKNVVIAKAKNTTGETATVQYSKNFIRKEKRCKRKKELFGPI